MTRKTRGMAALAGLSAVTLGLAACGGGSSSSSGGDSGEAKTGGTLKLLGAGGQDNFDPTSAYSTTSNTLMRGYARQLFGYPASTDATKASTPAPDIAGEL